MEGMFWPMLVIFAPIWSLIPLGIAQLACCVWVRPWYLMLIPTWLWLLSFAPWVQGSFSRGAG
jgi:hypothetical protein